MRATSFALCVLLCSSRGASASSPDQVQWQNAPWGAELDKEIELVKRSFSGDISIHARDPNRGVWYGFNAEKPSYLASGVKIAFMLEAFRQESKGELSFDEELTYGPEDIRDGATVLNPKPLGSKISMRALLEAMMQASDNSASDMIVRRVGLDRINQGLKELGYEGFTPLIRLIDVRRAVFREMDVRADDLSALDIRTVRWTPIWDPQVAKLTQLLGRPRGTFTKQDMLDAFDRFYATGVNGARLDTMSRILWDIQRGALISAEASERMLALMSHAKTSTRRILGKLPRGTRVAHKTGSQYERICDLGIIYLPEDRPLIFCACLSGGNNRTLAEDMLARLARKTYDLVLAN
jgi:beta-lactamase class A